MIITLNVPCLFCGNPVQFEGKRQIDEKGNNFDVTFPWEANCSNCQATTTIVERGKTGQYVIHFESVE